MTSKEKIEYVKNSIREQAEISPDGNFYMPLRTIIDVEANGGIPDEAPILISKVDQWSIVQKLQKEGFIKSARLQDDKNGIWIEAENLTKEKEGSIPSMSPDHTAELWVLWSQAFPLLQAYESNSTLDRKILEKLYLQIVAKAEKIIIKNRVGEFGKNYKRPFTSLATSEMEAIAKKFDTPLNIISKLLLQIAELDPPAEEIAKKVEENSQLIEAVLSATKAISGETIDLSKLSYEQALFILKIAVMHLYDVLEAVSTGFISTTDEELNVKYVLLLDYIEKIFERKDFEKIKESLPPYFPKNLFQDLDERDIWWEDGSGKSQMLNFQGDVETAWIKAGQQSFPVPPWLVVFFNTISDVVAKHKKNKTATWDRMMENLEERKNRGEFSFENFNSTSNPKTDMPDNFVVTLQDREIRINDFILSRPYATGKNMAFFEHIFSNPNKLLKRIELPELVRQDLGGKRFSTMLNGLGFKGQILQAFAPKRGKGSILFRKEVSTDVLKKESLKIDLLIRELELAHMKNSSK